MKPLSQTLRNQDGIALILVLLVISILAGMIFTFHLENQVELEISGNLRDEAAAYYIARSGIEAGLLLLIQDGRDTQRTYDSLDEDWAQFDQYALQAGILFEKGTLRGRIEDLDRRIDVNQLLDQNGRPVDLRIEQMERLFEVLEIEKGIIGAILDWLDRDNDTSDRYGLGYGAEKDYYERLNPPRVCKNGPMDDVSELRLIKGITDEMYFGKGEKPGLRDLLAVRTSGKININTASPMIFRTLAPDLMSGVHVQAILDRRTREPFRRVDEINDVYGLPAVGGQIMNLADIKSTYFLLEMEGEVNENRRLIRATVARTNNKIVKLFWQVE